MRISQCHDLPWSAIVCLGLLKSALAATGMAAVHPPCIPTAPPLHWLGCCWLGCCWIGYCCLGLPWAVSDHHRMALNAGTYNWMDGWDQDGNL